MAPQRRHIDAHRRARELRTQGVPFKQIASALGISPATAYAWTNDIQLTQEQPELNRCGPDGPHNAAAQRRRAAVWAAQCRAQRQAFQQRGRKAARRGDLLHQAGCMLYWAEGSKDRNSAKLSNSDPHMLLMWRRFLTDSLGVDRADLCLSINAYTNNGWTIDEIEAFWLQHLDLPPCVLRKHTINHMPTSSSGRAKNRLTHGVCSLSVHSTSVVQHIYGAIQEYAGFDEPRWLG